MMRPIAAYLLIVVLLVCPVFCLGEAAEACAPREKPACCQARDCGSSSDEEAPPAPREQQPDCVCHGAVFGVAGADGPQIASGHLPPLAVAAPAATVSDVVDATCWCRRDPRRLPSESGRHLCALFCTRLL